MVPAHFDKEPIREVSVGTVVELLQIASEHPTDLAKLRLTGELAHCTSLQELIAELKQCRQLNRKLQLRPDLIEEFTHRLVSSQLDQQLNGPVHLAAGEGNLYFELSFSHRADETAFCKQASIGQAGQINPLLPELYLVEIDVETGHSKIVHVHVARSSETPQRAQAQRRHALSWAVSEAIMNSQEPQFPQDARGRTERFLKQELVAFLLSNIGQVYQEYELSKFISDRWLQKMLPRDHQYNQLVQDIGEIGHQLFLAGGAVPLNHPQLIAEILRTPVRDIAAVLEHWRQRMSAEAVTAGKTLYA